MKIRSLFLASVIALAAPAAHAVTYVVTNIAVSSGTTDGSTTANVSQGDTVTIDFVAERGTTGDGITALGSSAYGYDATVSFVSGEAVGSFFNTFLSPPTGPAFGGFTNASSGMLSEQGGRVNLLQGVAVPPGLSGYSEDNDIGLGGVLVSAGGNHAQVIFQAAADGTTAITLGSDGNVDVVATATGGAEATVNAMVTVNVPEPASVLAGVTALGSVLGVAALRRRR